MSGVNVLAWIVLLIFADAVAQEDACQSKPCQNGGVCVTNRGDYTCHCSKEPQNGRLYGGPNCTVVLLGCERHRCQNGATCSPFLNSERQRYACSCSEGFTGARCEISTTFSFDKSGFLHLQTELEDRAELLNVTLSFRTVQPTATLLRCRVDDNILTVQLQNGRLRHLLERAQQSVFVELLHDVADAHWHTVQVLLHGNVLGLRLLDPSCTARTCHKEELVETEPGSGLDLSDFTLIQSVYIGGTGHGQANPELYFLGCMRDVHVQSYVVVPGSIVQAEQVNVSLGCRESDGCEEKPCKNRGKCIGLGWRKHTCECRRPYEGQTCSEEYIAARFGGNDSESYTVFTVDGEPRDSFTASMFVRTRRSNGLLLVFSNRTSRYLSVWLEDGKVHVQASRSERLRGYESVNDGHFHLVSVDVRPGSLSLSQSARAQASTKAQGLTIQAGDRVYVGGLEERDASSAFRSYFKGCIQDLRINSRRLQFYPLSTPVSSYSLERMVEVTRGCTADNSCRKNPCLNGGVCYSVWDDFACSCPPNTAGRRCEELKWCELSPCPPLAACRSHAQGFDCIAPVTLRKGNPIITFRGNGRIRRSLRSVALTFRTRSSDATLLHASREAEFISVSVLNGCLVVELQSGSSFLQMQSRQAVVSDGHWHSAVLTMDGPSAATSGWSMVLDERRDEASVSSTVSGGLDFLREGVDILLGGFELSSGADWDGCLGSVEIGGLVLPYYAEAELNVASSQEERFSMTSGTRDLGCWGSNVCDPNPCQNGGRCEDLFDLFKCRCPENWRGQRCEVDANPCASNPCVHGACVTSSEGYECVCEVGYAGPWCASEEDICAGHKCRNGGTCLRGFKRYACLCPRNTTGAHCQERVPELPWYIDRIPYPKLPVSVCGNEKWNYSCFNGGNCSVHQDTCDCLPGFTGQWCELEVDECASDPCLNGGFCRNLVNKFQCVCEISFAGDHCQIDVSDFYLYVFLLMWQNIFQLLSYLILRLDDEPEIEWNAANDD